ncbi:DUF4192 domain-containing protein [Nocardiopsis sp. CT-R113]|uniref:DUF4192 domain-containing protein n=1 Tax=Nocardiopsis codii TaxID=3065942 RepID=A0ABU7K9J0_9ACTN|nr:DUF4192 domain-containing protein [Nocardiopsis sp. CT-R113]MEE2038900.1 DUF4192 domain-containing protein [Nocardiopsis sp. CT-R113]
MHSDQQHPRDPHDPPDSPRPRHQPDQAGHTGAPTPTGALRDGPGSADPVPRTRTPDGGVSGDASSGALTLTNPTDIIATLPYLVGEPPDPGVVVLAIRGRGVHSVFCGDLDRMDTAPDPMRRAAAPVAAALSEGCTALAVVAYGPPERVTPYVDTLLAAARTRGLGVVDALRVTGGRYWSYTCASAGCCPAEGTLVNVDGSTVPASAVLHGIVPAPPFHATMADIARVRALLTPVDGEERAAMDAAADRAATRARELSARGAGGALTDRGVPAALAAVRSEREGEAVTDRDELAWLGVYLTETRVRDEVWARITAEAAPVHQALWSRVTRHLPADQRAAPASLLAVAAWQRGDEALAAAALDVALTAEPGYSMAVLMSRALAWGLPVERWREFTPRWLMRGTGPPRD